MNITFYNNTAECRRLDKTAYLTEVLSIEGTLREGCSLINPQIILQSTEIPNFNYAYIKEFGRMYYVTNVSNFRENLWLVSMQEDVLYSNNAAIYDLVAYVNRNEFTYDELLNDSKYPLESRTRVEVINRLDFKQQFPVEAGQNYCFIVCVINNENATGSVTSDLYNYGAIGSLITPTPATRPFCAFISRYLLNYNEFQKFCAWVNDDSTTRAPFVISVTSYPVNVMKFFTKNFQSTESDLPLGLLAADHITLGVDETYSKRFTNGIYSITNLVLNEKYLGSLSITNKFNNFLDYSPYTKVAVWLPFYGMVDLDTDRVMGKSVDITAILDIDNAQITYELDVGGIPVFQGSGEMGYNIPVTATNFGDIQRQHTVNDINKSTAQTQTAISAVSSILGGVGGVSSNAVKVQGMSNANMANASMAAGAVGAAFNAAQTVLGTVSAAIGINAEYETREILNVQSAYSNGGVNADANNYFNMERIYAIRYYTQPAISTDEDVKNYAHLFGRPLEKVVGLGTLQGTTTIGEVMLDGLTCLKEEKDMIYQWLVNGVIC